MLTSAKLTRFDDVELKHLPTKTTVRKNARNKKPYSSKNHRVHCSDGATSTVSFTSNVISGSDASTSTASSAASTRSYGIAGKTPLQVQRRNERERRRVQQVNHGYEVLAQQLSDWDELKDKKLTKAQTLKAAILYIEHMQRLLGSAEHAHQHKFELDDEDEEEEDGDDTMKAKKGFLQNHYYASALNNASTSALKPLNNENGGGHSTTRGFQVNPPSASPLSLNEKLMSCDESCLYDSIYSDHSFSLENLTEISPSYSSDASIYSSELAWNQQATQQQQQSSFLEMTTRGFDAANNYFPTQLQQTTSYQQQQQRQRHNQQQLDNNNYAGYNSQFGALPYSQSQTYHSV